MTPELIGILAVGATVIGLLLTFRREARADNQALRAEFRADNQRLRGEVRADMQNFREEIRSDLAALRKDVQALTERMRVEGVIARRRRHRRPLCRTRSPQRRRLTDPTRAAVGRYTPQAHRRTHSTLPNRPPLTPASLTTGH